MKTKFVSNKTVVDRANELIDLRARITAMKADLAVLVAEETDLEGFLAKAGRGDFIFNGEDGYQHNVEFLTRTRQDMNQEAVRKLLTKLGKRVPVKTVSWKQVKISYVKE